VLAGAAKGILIDRVGRLQERSSAHAFVRLERVSPLG
jgi:hypothetical protein